MYIIVYNIYIYIYFFFSGQQASRVSTNGLQSLPESKPHSGNRQFFDDLIRSVPKELGVVLPPELYPGPGPPLIFHSHESTGLSRSIQPPNGGSLMAVPSAVRSLWIDSDGRVDQDGQITGVAELCRPEQTEALRLDRARSC